MQRKTRIGVGKEEVGVCPPESIIKLREDLGACCRGKKVLARIRHGLEGGTKTRDGIWGAIARIDGAKTLEGKDG
jgi:hypothetical protein